MLGKTAGGLFWMFRLLERSENIARLVDAGFRIALTRSTASADDWASVVATAGVREAYRQRHSDYGAANVIDFLLRDRSNPSSVMSAIDGARSNARLVRTALTREVWEATNECWMALTEQLARPVSPTDLPEVLVAIRKWNALVQGALQGTMLRNDIYNFARIGTFLERADNTARILDVKYYVLLPSLAFVGSSLDNVQWETILRSLSAKRAYSWLNESEASPMGIAHFLMLDARMPRSLAFCYGKLRSNLNHLAQDYGDRRPCHDAIEQLYAQVSKQSIDVIFETGLHEFIVEILRSNSALGSLIEHDYRFYR
jgi:uncharacterized alpha-E superfamily protein